MDTEGGNLKESECTFGRRPRPITGIRIVSDGNNPVEIDCANGWIISKEEIYDTNDVAKIELRNSGVVTIYLICREEVKDC